MFANVIELDCIKLVQPVVGLQIRESFQLDEVVSFSILVVERDSFAAKLGKGSLNLLKEFSDDCKIIIGASFLARQFLQQFQYLLSLNIFSFQRVEEGFHLQSKQL